jgi:UDP-GlcNAc:undecaprenyl-phosphate GlcNAc-1-phosphate transferase
MCIAFVLTILTGFGVVFLASKGWFSSWLPAFVILEAASILEKLPQVLLLLGVGTGMMIIGWIDDAKDLPPLTKLIGQAVFGTILVMGGISATIFIPYRVVAGIVTVFWIVTVVNAFNFLDNMDGLCAGVALVAGAIFTAVAVQTGQLFVAAMLLAYMGTLAGFLIFNFHPASIFMGDAGSFFVGFTIAALTVVFTFTEQTKSVYAILTPLLILALPVFDMAYVLFLRLRSGNVLYVGDHSHVSHRLVDLGMTPKTSVLTIYLMTFCTGLAAVMLRQMNTTGAICAVVQVICFLILIFLVEGSGRKT